MKDQQHAIKKTIASSKKIKRRLQSSPTGVPKNNVHEMTLSTDNAFGATPNETFVNEVPQSPPSPKATRTALMRHQQQSSHQYQQQQHHQPQLEMILEEDGSCTTSLSVMDHPSPYNESDKEYSSESSSSVDDSDSYASPIYIESNQQPIEASKPLSSPATPTTGTNSSHTSTGAYVSPSTNTLDFDYLNSGGISNALGVSSFFRPRQPQDTEDDLESGSSNDVNYNLNTIGGGGTASETETVDQITLPSSFIVVDTERNSDDDGNILETGSVMSSLTKDDEFMWWMMGQSCLVVPYAHRYKKHFCVFGGVVFVLVVLGVILIAGICGGGGLCKDNGDDDGTPPTNATTTSNSVASIGAESPMPSISPAPSSHPTPTPVPFESLVELYDAVDSYLGTGFADPAYGHPIGVWDISKLNSLFKVFSAERNSNATMFNDTSISQWDTSNVRSLAYTFENAKLFDGNLSTWNTNRVTTLESTFSGASQFSGAGVSEWNTNKVSNMIKTFRNAFSFDADLSKWETDRVTDMTSTFRNAIRFKGNGLKGWQTSAVVAMASMFQGALSFNGVLSDWKTGAVENMRSIFQHAVSFNSDISKWDVSEVTDMSGAFMMSCNFKADLKDWDVKNVENVTATFFGAHTFNSDIADWVLQEATYSDRMFAAATEFEKDLCSWSLTIYSSDRETRKSMFVASGCETQDDPIPNQHYISPYCSICNDSIQQTVDIIPAVLATNETRSYAAIRSNKELRDAISKYSYFSFLDSNEARDKYGLIGDWDVSGISNFSHAFDNLNIFENFNEDLSRWDVSRATSMKAMFQGLKNFNGNISTWDTSNVQDMDSTFRYCGSFNGDISNWDVSSVTSLAYFMDGADRFDGDLSSWETRNVVDMTASFRTALSFTGVGTEDWDVSNVESFARTFESAASFIADLSLWNVGSATDMSYMFLSASIFNSDISEWDVSNVVNFEYCFSATKSFNQDVSAWVMSSVERAQGMFAGSTSFNRDLCKWKDTFASLKDVYGMFVATVCTVTDDPGEDGPFCNTCS